MSTLRPRQRALQRVTPNQGNRRFLKGGKLPATHTPTMQAELQLDEEPAPAKTRRRRAKPEETP